MAAAAALPSAVRAQQLEPKRDIGASAAASCPSSSTPSAPSAQRRAAAHDLFLQGQEAAISGETRTAADLFRRAAESDPTDATTAYHLARTHEALGEVNEAIREYCRFLSLAPRAADAQEVRQRLAELGPRRSTSEAALVQFRAGLNHYGSQQWREAQAAFTRAIGAAPDWPEPHFNRALVMERLDQNDRAVADFQRYLELEPAAADRALVQRRMIALRREMMSPSTALTRGLLLPGLGQHYTGRTVLGVVVLGAVGGAVVYGFQPRDREVTEIRTGTFIDPFGNEREYEYEFKYVDRQYPYRTGALAAAAAVWALAAIESWHHARSVTSSPPPSPIPSRAAVPLIEFDWGAAETRIGVSVRF